MISISLARLAFGQPPSGSGTAATDGQASAAVAETWAVDTASSRIYVFVDKGSLIGHAHGIEGRLASGTLVLGQAANAGQLVFDMTSFVADTPAARTALRLEGDVDASTKQQTTANMLSADVLDATRHPTATFAVNSSLLAANQQPGGLPTYRLEGRFTLRGATRPLTLLATFEQRPQDAVMRGRFTLTQTAYGIRPYAKFGGIVTIADDLQVHGGLRLVPAAGSPGDAQP